MRHAFLVALLLLACRVSAAESNGDALVATYRLISPEALPSDWRFVRSPDCVTVARVAGPLVEHWQRLDHGQVRYLRVFPGRRWVIEYRPADVAVDWTAVAGVVDAGALATMRRGLGGATALGRSTLNYYGTANGTNTEIWWLAEERLPARIRQVQPNGAETSLTLISLEHARGEAARCGTDLEGYAWLDFADAGDRHDDPIVRELLRFQESWRRVVAPK